MNDWQTSTVQDLDSCCVSTVKSDYDKGVLFQLQCHRCRAEIRRLKISARKVEVRESEENNEA